MECSGVVRVWNPSARHCPVCAAHLVPADVEARRRLRCSACTFVLYENPPSAAAGVVLDDARRVLLIRRAFDPYKGSWALPAGFQEMDEAPAETVVREVFEESGIQVEVLTLFDLLFVAAAGRRPANLAVFLCRPVGGDLRAGHDALEAAWFDLDALPADLGFDNGPRILDRIDRADPDAGGRSRRAGRP